MAVLGSDNLSHSTTFKFNIDSADRVTIDSSGRLLVNTNTAYGAFAVTPQFQISGTNFNGTTSSIVRWGTAADVSGGGIVSFSKSRGATGVQQSVLDLDELGTVRWAGSDGTQFVQGAMIRALVNKSPSTGRMPAQLEFHVAADDNLGMIRRAWVDAEGFNVLNSGGQSYIEVGQGTSSNQFAFLDLTGDTTYPDYGLRVIRGSAGANSISEIAHRGNGTFSLNSQDSGDIAFTSGGNERMRIKSFGVVCIGHNSLTAGTGGVISPIGYMGRTGVNGGFVNVFNIAWTGSVADLWIDASNIGGIVTSSDHRIKKNIQTQTSPAIERIKLLRPITYELKDYKNLFKADGIQREGFIAHEVQEVIPSGAEGEKDEENRIQNLRLDAIVSVLTKALQEVIEKIENLENQLELLSSN
jgi:hypothetical protein